MKKQLILTGLFAVALTTAQASVFTFSSGTLNQNIADANPAGYSSTIAASGIIDDLSDDTILDVNVTLNITGGFNGDLYGYLVSPDGALSVLLNRVGRTSGNAFGYSDAGFSVTLDDGNADIHTSTSGGGVLSGTFSPDGRAVNPANVLDTDSQTALLAAMNGGNGNGTWTLFLADLSGGAVSQLGSWSLSIDVVPEPTTWALMIFGGIAATMIGFNVYRRRTA
jgi:subtilisin-like proprotein convertase family protein